MNAADPMNSEMHAIKKFVNITVEPRRYSKRNLAQRAIKKVVNINVVDPRNLEKHAIKKVVDIAVEPRRHSKRNLAKHMIVRNPRNSVEH